jgi:hypothetical protein
MGSGRLITKNISQTALILLQAIPPMSAGPKEDLMCHRNFLKAELLKLLRSNLPPFTSWHSEYDLEAFFVAQGYNLDVIQDVIDHMINEGQVDFGTDAHDGDQLVCLATEAIPEPNRVGLGDEQ